MNDDIATELIQELKQTNNILLRIAHALHGEEFSS